MPLFAPAFKTFQHYHLPHHSYVTIDPDSKNMAEVQRDERKRPVYDLDLPTEFEAWLFSSNPLTRMCFLVFQVFCYIFRPMFISPKSLEIEDFIGLITQSLYLGSAWYFAGVGAFIYLVSSTFLGQGFHVSAIHFVAEHYLLIPETSDSIKSYHK